MKAIAFVIIILVFTVTACEDESADPTLKAKFDAIEKIVGNDNWRVIKGNDTSCFYFSRDADLHMNVHLFRMKKGDSTGAAIAEMLTIKGRNIFWTWGKEMTFLLRSVNDTAINWVEIKSEKKCTMLKIDSSHISFTFPRLDSFMMQKTLPLATFLVRSHYDYLHGTSLVDSPLVNAKH